MNMKQYVKIKEFSELTGVSVRTLQYYDEIGLMKPEYTNENDHRFYDSNSFSKMFVILSLKNMGMSLSDIHQYINGNDFNIQAFIEEEKHRLESAITDIQLRLMRLNNLGHRISEKEDISPYILPLFSNMTRDTKISDLQIDDLMRMKDNSFDFNIKDWNLFIRDLNFCLNNRLSVKDKKAIKCINYWKENVIKANQISEDIIRFAEEFYQHNPENSFGLTEDSYKYLIQLMEEHDKIHR